MKGLYCFKHVECNLSIFHTFCSASQYLHSLWVTKSAIALRTTLVEAFLFMDFVTGFGRILHSCMPPLEIGSTYWSLRDSIVQCELFLARALQFHFAVDHPHKVRN